MEGGGGVNSSVTEPEPPGAAPFLGSSGADMSVSVRAKSRSRRFKASPAASFRKAKKKSLFCSICKDKYDPKKFINY